ncbi:MAG: alpha/beta hydrolase [Spirochaetaceae bacterium]|nr:alpha/beta hydrolase [Spirochaetaceae bacterium]
MISDFAMVQGMQLFYVTAGTGIPLVYIHGNTGSSRWFSRVMELPGFQTYALDLPNFGRSQALPGDVDIHRYADAVVGFIDAMKLQNPVIVGHSLGGTVAQSLAGRYPDSVRAMVLVDSSTPAGLITPKEHYPFIEIMRSNRAVLSNALHATTPTLTDQVLFEALVDDAICMAQNAWVGNADALGHFDVSAQTASFGKPVLVIWGRKDSIINEEMARATAAAYPNSVLKIVETVGHSIIVEDPVQFKDLLEQFLAALPR